MFDAVKRLFGIAKPNADELIDRANRARLAGDYNAANVFYMDAIGADPNNWVAHMGLGLTLCAMPVANTVALLSLQEAVRLAPTELAALEALGLAYCRAGSLTEGLAVFRRMIAANADDADGYINSGNALRMLRQPDEATEMYRSAVPRMTEPSMAHLNLGLVLLDEKRLDEASAAFELAAPARMQALFHLAQVEQARGNHAEATRRLESFIERGQSVAEMSAFVARAEQMLKEMRS